jgi:type 1 glutamine amidotransferase
VWDSWRPDFTRYAAVIDNFNGGHKADGIRWPRQVEASLDAYTRGGGGLVIFHAANNAFLEWADYNEMIGLGWRDRTFGPGLILDDRERVQVIPAGEGLDPGHGPRHDFEITVVDPRHSITRGLPKKWMHPSEQLTHGQHAPANPTHGAPEKVLRMLTYAWSKDSKRNEPMDWVRDWGKGRIYVTMLGHTWKGEENPNLEDPNFRRLFANGVAWAAGNLR